MKKILLAVFSLAIMIEIGITAKIVRTELLVNIDAVKTHLLETDLTQAAKDLKDIGQNQDFQTYLNQPTTENQKKVIQFFKQIENKRHYDQLRFIDTSGQEKIRLNLNNGKIQVIPTANLQFKGVRYYFEDTVKLGPKEFYISPVDLNVEHGEIEIPHKPVLRIATPVFDGHGDKKGVLVINLIFTDLIKQIQSINKFYPYAKYYLVDSHGYWIKSPNNNQQFEYQHDQHNTITNQYPNIWEKLTQKESLTELNSKGFFITQKIYPIQAIQLNHDRKQQFSYYTNNLKTRDFYWIIILYTHPLGFFFVVFKRAMIKFLPLNLALVVGLSLIYFVIRSLKKKNRVH